MTDAARLARNAEKLAECNRQFALRVALVIERLEQEGFRPRIQDAWRTPVAQASNVAAGNSKVRWSFHQASTPNGEPDALAVDMLDDNYPVPVSNQRDWPLSFRHYLIWLAVIASQHDLETGIAWGLGVGERRQLNQALSNDPLSYRGALGWDPTHVEIRDLTLAAARRGVRPWVDGEHA